MNLSLSNMLSSSASGLDPDAKGYIDAVVTAGATVSATQKKAINTFVKTGKSDGWYSSIKRMYLPIWASAAPNAIDMIGRTSGTFNGTVTHGAGYVQGDGSTGYFNTHCPKLNFWHCYVQRIHVRTTKDGIRCIGNDWAITQ
jgi:hypothetical protein